MRLRIALPLGAAVAAATAVVLTLLAPGAPAHATDHCPSAGGENLTHSAKPQEGHFVFAGRGWGHGAGMSQYGAQGAARLGCTAGQILRAYYEGIDIEQIDAPGNGSIRVGIAPNRPGDQPVERYRATNTGDEPIPWRLFDDRGREHTVDMAPGRRWTIEMEGGEFVVHVGTRTEFRGDGLTDIRAMLLTVDGRQVELQNGRPYERGAIWFAAEGSNRFSVQARLGSIEEYLLGVREVPGGFPLAAQEAQAITARAFAYAKRANGLYGNCDCHIYDSTSDQVYAGALAEPERWLRAVRNTEKRVLRRDGSTVTAHYASSHGGHSESAQFVWGGSVPHEQPVDDSRWDLASDNPYRTWSLALTPQEAGERLGVGVLLSVDLPQPKGAAGRIGHPDRGYGGMVAEGTERTRVLSGDQVRSALGASQLRSSLFTVAEPPGIARGDATQLSVSWGDDGSLPAWFSDGRWALLTPDGQVLRFNYGRAGDVPLVGDWNGDGTDTVGIVRDRTWHLRHELAGGPADRSFIYGRVGQGDLPLVGDWNGNGTDGVGIVRGREWHLRNSQSGGTSDVSFVYGRITAGDVPVTGDWSRNGIDTVGIVRDGTWHLRNSLSGGPAENSFPYGRATDRPVVGDWNDDGRDTAGVVRGTSWYLRNRNSGGGADLTYEFAG
jgi:peptidoglycan hydrolase-like amidase